MLKFLLSAFFVAHTSAAPSFEHVLAAAEPGTYCGWPANHGPMRAWGDELVVAFTAGAFKIKGPGRHAFDSSKPQACWLSRSLDGGRTWKIEKPDALRGHQDPKAAPIGPATGDIRSANPDCMILCGYDDEDRGWSWFQVSQNRGRTWGGRQALPEMGLRAINGRTDYVLDGAAGALFCFVTPKTAGGEGRVVAARTTDGGKTWTREGFVGPDPAKGYSIHPSTVRLDTQRLVCATRRQEPQKGSIEIHASADDGKTWRTLGTAAITGSRSSAGDMIRLRDGRLALAYAQREAGKICARLSPDDGVTWGAEVTLRDNAGSWDIGYPRLAQRADGGIVCAYYWNDDPLKECVIAATIWIPPAK